MMAGRRLDWWEYLSKEEIKNPAPLAMPTPFVVKEDRPKVISSWITGYHCRDVCIEGNQVKNPLSYYLASYLLIIK